MINIAAQMFILFRIFEKHEYNGLRARRYPHQLKIRKKIPEPRRDILEEVHQQLVNTSSTVDTNKIEKEQKKILSTRKKMDEKLKRSKTRKCRLGEKLETVIEMPDVD